MPPFVSFLRTTTCLYLTYLCYDGAAKCWRDVLGGLARRTVCLGGVPGVYHAAHERAAVAALGAAARAVSLCAPPEGLAVDG